MDSQGCLQVHLPLLHGNDQATAPKTDNPSESVQRTPTRLQLPITLSVYETHKYVAEAQRMYENVRNGSARPNPLRPMTPKRARVSSNKDDGEYGDHGRCPDKTKNTQRKR